MAESTVSTFGSNSRPLSIGNPIIFGTGAGAKPAIVLAVSSTAPTKIAYLDENNSPIANEYDNGGSDIPQDTTPGVDATTIAAGKWIPVLAPPVR